MAIFTINVRPRIKLGVAGRSRESFITGEAKEYAEVRVTSLKSDTAGGSILAAVYNWFKGLFPALVDGSVKSYIIGLLTVVKDLASRVGLLEDKLILEYTVPVDAYSVLITQDSHGNALNLTGEFELCRKSFVGCNNGRVNVNTFYINGINSAIYYQTTSQTSYYGINGRGGGAYSVNRHVINVEDGAIFWETRMEASDSISVAPTIYTAAGHSDKSLQQINSITSIELKDGAGSVIIKAGTIITIKKL